MNDETPDCPAASHRNHTKDAEGKLLVQIAFQFERESLRINWDYLPDRPTRVLPAPPSNAPWLSVRKRGLGARSDGGDHPAISTDETGAAVADGDTGVDTITSQVEHVLGPTMKVLPA
ncbi:hypothetical protein PC118_g22337 [Phytophthora cactorum]|uniref:Uncharacterized protein n=1 Tax=Phytophthora cactorum TaxID=29920 RepID=A0A8T1EXD9_9STRA|nr:hypothetical protein PC118_g22337 [Phytophthora cactorum]